MRASSGRSAGRFRRPAHASACAVLTAGIVLASASLAQAAFTQVAVWGSDGSGDGQLHYPALDATDRKGNVYVADEQNSRVVKFGPRGEFRLTWGWGVKDGEPRLETCRSDCQTGLYGAGRGEFNAPYGIAVHARRVYVTDPANDRVQVFSPRGEFLAQWGRGGSERRRLSNPHGIATDPAGRVYVADTSNDRIVKFTADGRFIRKWGGTGTGDGTFQAPWDLATDRDRHLYVTDYFNDRVQKFTLGGRFLRTWGWGVRTGRNRFEICTRHCLIGRGGPEDGQLSLPEGIATDSRGIVYVADPSYSRIERFKPGGPYLNEFELLDSFAVPHGVAIDRADRVYVTTSRGQVVKFARSD